MSALVFALMLAASSPEAALEPALGNVIVSTHPDGRQAKLRLNRDHTYLAEGRKGQRSSGVWKMKGQKLCLSQKKPHPGLFSYCKRLPKITAGATWSDTAVTGERVTNRIVPGG